MKRLTRGLGTVCSIGFLLLAAGCSAPGTAAPTTSATPTVAGPRGEITVTNFTDTVDTTTPAFRIDATHWAIFYKLTSQNCPAASASISAYNTTDPNAYVRSITVGGCVTSSLDVQNGPGDFFIKIHPVNAVFTIEVDEIR